MCISSKKIEKFILTEEQKCFHIDNVKVFELIKEQVGYWLYVTLLTSEKYKIGYFLPEKKSADKLFELLMQCIIQCKGKYVTADKLIKYLEKNS